jgi:hypothetical protein
MPVRERTVTILASGNAIPYPVRGSGVAKTKVKIVAALARVSVCQAGKKPAISAENLTTLQTVK